MTRASEEQGVIKCCCTFNTSLSSLGCVSVYFMAHLHVRFQRPICH